MYKHVMSVCLLWSMHPATVEPTLTHINCPSSPLPANHPRCLAHYRVVTNVMTSGFTSRETGHGPLDISTWTHNWLGGCTNWGRPTETDCSITLLSAAAAAATQLTFSNNYTFYTIITHRQSQWACLRIHLCTGLISKYKVKHAGMGE